MRAPWTYVGVIIHTPNPVPLHALFGFPLAIVLNIPDLLTLMIYYVKCGNDFTLEFDDIDEAYYESLCSMFAKVVQTLLAQDDRQLIADFLPALETEFRRVDDKIGWGYPDELSDHLADLRNAFD